MRRRRRRRRRRKERKRMRRSQKTKDFVMSLFMSSGLNSLAAFSNPLLHRER